MKLSKNTSDVTRLLENCVNENRRTDRLCLCFIADTDSMGFMQLGTAAWTFWRKLMPVHIQLLVLDRLAGIFVIVGDSLYTSHLKKYGTNYQNPKTSTLQANCSKSECHGGQLVFNASEIPGHMTAALNTTDPILTDLTQENVKEHAKMYITKVDSVVNDALRNLKRTAPPDVEKKMV